jgi:tetratricopeptide (TPR) repeat protein
LAYAYAIRWVEHGEGDFAEKLAREHLNRAKKTHIDHSHAIVADAYIRFYSGETETALRSLSQSVEEKGKSSSLLLSSLGILQLRSGDLDKAAENLRAAQNLAPSDARINAALGHVYRCLGDEYFDNYEAALRYHKAANSYDAALRYQKDHGEALLGVVLMSIDTNRIEAARAVINSILNDRRHYALSPRQMALAHLARAIVLDADNEQAKADQAEADAFQIDSRNPDLLLLKARRLVRNGKADEAAKAVQEAIRRDLKRSSYRVQLAKMLLAKPGTGPKEAAQAIQEAIRAIPNANKLYVVLGDILRTENRLDEAKNAYEKAIAAFEKAPDARLALADIALSKKDYSKAIVLYEKAREEFVERSRDDLISSARKQSYLLTEIAKMLEARGDRKAAFEKFRQAVRVDPSYPPPVFNCGRILVADKDKQNRDKGFTMLEQYLKFDPKGEYADEASRLIGERRR